MAEDIISEELLLFKEEEERIGIGAGVINSPVNASIIIAILDEKVMKKNLYFGRKEKEETDEYRSTEEEEEEEEEGKSTLYFMGEADGLTATS
jgi:hypothetical protein